MNELSQILSEATAAIAHDYFHLEIDGGSPIYRERVYCYELYHQMRLRWPKETCYFLNGEVDKRAHPILRKLGADHAIPDLLVHQPGDMKLNHAVIEVKRSQTDAAGITKDLETLCKFTNKVGYQRAIYIMFGRDANAAMARKIQQRATLIPELVRIELWLHQAAGQPAGRYLDIQCGERVVGGVASAWPSPRVKQGRGTRANADVAVTLKTA